MLILLIENYIPGLYLYFFLGQIKDFFNFLGSFIEAGDQHSIISDHNTTMTFTFKLKSSYLFIFSFDLVNLLKFLSFDTLNNTKFTKTTN